MSVTIPPKFSALTEAALVLEPSNFTPRTRTPWAGTRISTRLKGVAETPIGESWEVSVEPQFPSRVQDDGRELGQWLLEAPSFYLGRAASLGCALLVKLLDTCDRLSLQIHPHGHESFLAADESGKPESWLVLDADPGAGIYLGLAEGVMERDMREAIKSGSAQVEEVLHFEAVQPGDFFRIDAGTPHAIGSGLTLVEPQRVQPRRKGVTYRYYDWARRYDAEGRLDEGGAPRALHLEQALRVTDWRAPRGSSLISKVRAQLPVDVNSLIQLRHALGQHGALHSGLLEVASCAGTGSLRLPWPDALCAVTIVAGHCTLQNSAGKTRMRCGQSAVLPAALAPETLIDAEQAHVVLCSAS